MASIEILEKMDTAGKRHQRLAIANTILDHFPSGSDGYIITLGGLYTDKNGNLIKGSEIWWFLEVCNWNPARIISVDKDITVVERNQTNTDPKCKGIINRCGDFVDIVGEYTDTDNISVVNFDSCGDANTYGWQMAVMMDNMNARSEGEKTLFLTNWNIKGRSTGGSYDAYEIIKNGGFSQNEQEYSFHQIRRGFSSELEEYTDSSWKHYGAELNGKKDVDFLYIGGYNTPMQSVWFVREGKVTIKRKNENEKSIITKKNGKSSAELTAIAKKAWETRRANGN